MIANNNGKIVFKIISNNGKQLADDFPTEQEAIQYLEEVFECDRVGDIWTYPGMVDVEVYKVVKAIV
jgi:hypothetical protein